MDPEMLTTQDPVPGGRTLPTHYLPLADVAPPKHRFMPGAADFDLQDPVLVCI